MRVMAHVCLWGAACAAIACGGNKSGAPDAAVTIDAAATIDAGATFDAKPSCNVLFLQFESQPLVGGATEDATMNKSSVITGNQTAPGYRPNDSQRATKIADMTLQVKNTLAPLGVTVVSTRPASGDYSMVVIGGASENIGLPAGFGGDAPFAGCDQPIPKRVTFVFDNVQGAAVSQIQIANLAISSYLVSLGMPTSSDSADCLCWDSPSCMEKVACTIGGAQTPRYQQSQCGSGATFDEPAKLAQLLACP